MVTKISFKEDQRKENPGLHLLYTKRAITHLAQIEEIQKKLSSFSNTNMIDISLSVERERQKLIKNNAAYADANEILDSIRHLDFYRKTTKILDIEETLQTE